MNHNTSVGNAFTLLSLLSIVVSASLVLVSRFGEPTAAKNLVLCLGVIGILLTILKEYSTSKATRKRAAEEKQVREVADSAHRTAAAAILGRRLSDEQKAAIRSNFADLNFAELKVMISYIPNTTEAQDFARSIAKFLEEFSIHCEQPFTENLQAGPQPKPAVSGTLFIVATNAPEKARILADAFGSAVPEIRRSGENSAWPFATNIFQIRVIVGQKM